MIHTEPDYIDVTPELEERLDRFYAAHKDDPLGEVATQILFEDDRVKIWEMKLEPGEASAKHCHENDFYLVIAQGDVIAGIVPEADGARYFAARVPENGNTVPLEKGGTEWAYNAGKETFREVLIELKGT